jgi:hypothetical protein
MSLYRIVTVPLEVRCRHAEDEPSLTELVEWLREGGLEVDLNEEDCPSPVAEFVSHFRIDWEGVVESLGCRPNPWAHENEREEDGE